MKLNKCLWVAFIALAISKDPIAFVVAVSYMIAGLSMAGLTILVIAWLGNKMYPCDCPKRPVGELRIDFEIEQSALDKDMSDATKAIERLRAAIESKSFIVIDMGIWGK